MRFLILNTDYPENIDWLYDKYPELENEPYEYQMCVRNETLFGASGFYSANLHKLGHEAYDIRANNEVMQKAWAKEHGIKVRGAIIRSQRRRKNSQSSSWVTKKPLQYFRRLVKPLGDYLTEQSDWFTKILEAQIKFYRPDVIINQSIGMISSQIISKIKTNSELLIGQIASPLPQKEDFRCYDLVISSLPNLVEKFRNMGIPSELHKLGFEPETLSKLNKKRGDIPVSFVGLISPNHKKRIKLLEYISRSFDIRVWGMGIENLAEDSPIRHHHRGRAWGIDMYQILCDSRITLNSHIDMAGDYANNMRLFEATGTGTLLITDWKKNLHEMFEPGKEVVTYQSPEECAKLIEYYLKHDDERESISRAGQKRTLREHTYYQRMKELVDIIQNYV